MIPPCKCGHSRDDHDYGYGTCTNCECGRFDEDGSFMECDGAFSEGAETHACNVAVSGL
jgi:hypothetical protein